MPGRRRRGCSRVETLRSRACQASKAETIAACSGQISTLLHSSDRREGRGPRRTSGSALRKPPSSSARSTSLHCEPVSRQPAHPHPACSGSALRRSPFSEVAVRRAARHAARRRRSGRRAAPPAGARWRRSNRPASRSSAPRSPVEPGALQPARPSAPRPASSPVAQVGRMQGVRRGLSHPCTGPCR